MYSAGYTGSNERFIFHFFCKLTYHWGRRGLGVMMTDRGRDVYGFESQLIFRKNYF